MTDHMQASDNIEAPTGLPIQPTGNGVTDLEIQKLETAVEDGSEGASIEVPIPDDEPTKTQA